VNFVGQIWCNSLDKNKSFFYVHLKNLAMNYAFGADIHPKISTKSIFMDFFSVHKWTLLMFGGGLLTVPILKDLPPEAGGLGFLLIAIGAWRQIVEVLHTKAEARRKEELHQEQIRREKELHLEKMRLLVKLHSAPLEPGDFAVLKELLGG
jgi:hypothetical protein